MSVLAILNSPVRIITYDIGQSVTGYVDRWSGVHVVPWLCLWSDGFGQVAVCCNVIVTTSLALVPSHEY